MILRSPTEHENAELRLAGMDRRHPGSQDASGDIHVGLDSSTPCWNDAIEDLYQRLTETSTRVFSKEETRITKKSNSSTKKIKEF